MPPAASQVTGGARAADDLRSKVGFYLKHLFEPAPNASRSPLLARIPLVAVAVVVAWNLWSLRSVTQPVSYLNDAAVHEEMVRFATKTILAGRLPFTSWFPYTGLGSAQYMRYQGLGSALAGLVGTVFGAGTTFRWSMYLLVSFWPFAIYSSARLFGLRRRVALAAALLCSFMVSHTGIGFERGAYSWTGGAEVWTQLLASWTLPFAWASTWRAMRDLRFAWLASALIGLTIAFHFESGYLGLLAVIVIALVAPAPLGRRLSRGALVFAGSLVAAAWAIVPIMVFRATSATNQFLANTPYVKGYGAHQVLAWLFTGQVFDARRRVPVISVIVLAGVLLAIACWQRAPVARAFLALFVASLLLTFGPTTWGALANIVPAHADLYFRRFQMGAQLAGIYMAGAGAAWAWDTAYRLVRTFTDSPRWQRALLAGVAAGGGGWLWPAFSEIAKYDTNDAAISAVQRHADATEGRMVAPLVAYIKAHGQGRVYAGLPSNWGSSFRVGYVPVFKYLLSQDVDEMTYVVPSLSLMLDAEADFDEDNPADYPLFGVRYLLLPAGMSTPVPAEEVMADGNYALWQVASSGYVSLVQVTGVISADRADIGSRFGAFLDEVGPHQEWAVRWPGLAVPAGVPASAPLLGTSIPGPGVVDGVQPDLPAGTLRTEVTLQRPGALLLSVAYDPGWHAWVDGRPLQTQMLAPALVGVDLGPGTHDVVFRYEGFAWYPELWALGLLGLVGMGMAGYRRAKGVTYGQV
ncbi:MAG: YfhO family protein [Acidimicrobiales bacterium]